MGGRRRKPAMMDRAVTSDPLSRAVTPERPQLPRGATNLWPVLRDSGTPAAVARGEYDPILGELLDMARAHDLQDLARAVDEVKALRV